MNQQSLSSFIWPGAYLLRGHRSSTTTANAVNFICRDYPLHLR